MEQELNDLGQAVGLPVAGWKPPPIPRGGTLPGRLCRLEPLEARRHAAELYQANALDRQGKMWTYLMYGPFDTFEEYRQWMNSACVGGDRLFFAIVELKNQRAVGVSAYLRIDPPNGSIEVGHLAFSPLLQRTAAATEAMYLMMSNAFELGYRRYEWKCDALNAASRAAAMRLGFRFEGIFRKAVVCKGRNRDTAWYSIIDSQWPAMKAGFKQWLDESNFDGQGRQKRRLGELLPPA